MGWLRQLFSRRYRYDERSASIREHLDEKIADLLDRGMCREEAERAARREFGNMTLIEQRSLEVWKLSTLESILADVRYTFRQLRRAPGFAVTATVVLALGIGARVALFAFVDAALLDPVPYANPIRLMSVNEGSAESSRWPLSYSNYLDWQRLNKSFSSLDVYAAKGYLLRTSSGQEPILAERVSGSLFQTLGIRPILGRDFLAGEDRFDGPNVALLSYGTWLHRFGARRDELNNQCYTVIGVLPQSFVFAPAVDSPESP